MEKFTLNTLADLPIVANRLIQLAGEKRIFLFDAPMGAGKTTIIKALCEVLGTTEAVTSPTFSIVNEYAGKESPIYHFDFYRLKNEQEALDLGYEEYFYSGNYCFVEWPQKISSLLPENAFIINIGINSDQSRSLRIVDAI